MAAPAGQAVVARPWLTVIREVAADRVSQIVFASVTLVVGFAYSVLLPFAFTEQITLANWQFFTLRDGWFAAGLAVGLAWVITLQVYATRRIVLRAAGGQRKGGVAGALAAVVSVLPSFLCCTPFVPTVVSLIGLPAATQLSTTGNITYFFATYQNWLLTGALALLVISGAWSVRKLSRAQCLQGSCPVPGPDVNRPPGGNP